MQDPRNKADDKFIDVDDPDKRRPQDPFDDGRFEPYSDEDTYFGSRERPKNIRSKNH